jgi:hypothetical protein
MSEFLKDPIWSEMAKVHVGAPQRHEDDHGVFSTYHLTLNLLTFIKGKLNCRVTIVGLPLSLSDQGYSYKDEVGRQNIIKWIKAQKGISLILNGSDDFEGDFVKLDTLPSHYLENRFASVVDYNQHLRSHYRYRFKKAKKRFSTVTPISNPVFDEDLYHLYEAVYKKSAFPLEKCTPDYFKTVSASIEAFYVEGQVIGFYQYIVLDNVLYFIFCGLNYAVLATFDTYYNMLLHMIEKGIALGVKGIDFGQTTEDIKQKLGALPVSKKIYLYHSNALMRGILKILGPLGSYRPPKAHYKVFKKE